MKTRLTSLQHEQFASLLRQVAIALVAKSKYGLLPKKSNRHRNGKEKKMKFSDSELKGPNGWGTEASQNCTCLTVSEE